MNVTWAVKQLRANSWVWGASSKIPRLLCHPGSWNSLACSPRCLNNGLHFIMILRDHRPRNFWKLFSIFRSFVSLTWQDFGAHMDVSTSEILPTDISYCCWGRRDCVTWLEPKYTQWLSHKARLLLWMSPLPVRTLPFPTAAGRVQWYGQTAVQMAHCGVNFGQWEREANGYILPLCGYLQIGKGTYSLP